MDAPRQQSELRENIQALLDLISPLLAGIDRYSWTGPDADQFWEFLRRAAIVRQHEAIQAILKMSDIGCGHFGNCFLRPAYEEMLWIEYLDRNPAFSKELSHLMPKREIAESIIAQNTYLGVKGMAAVGFTQRFVKRYLAHARENEARLREIGRSLGWREGQSFPSVAFIARKVNREREYNFLYHATSRYVHFSSHELGRRIWGKKGEVRITSSSFTHYWNDFAMYWGFRIWLETLSLSKLELFKEPLQDDNLKSVLERIEKLSPVQIITASELESWND